MAIWHWQDNRYKQERILLLASVGALVVALAMLGWMYWPEEPGTQAEVTPKPVRVFEEEKPALVAAAEKQARREKLEELRKSLDRAAEAGDVAETERMARSILKEEPNDAEASSRMGWVWEKKGDAAQALAAYDKAAKIKPPNVQSARQAYYLYQKACLLRKGGDFEAAIAALQEAARLYPSSSEASNMLMIFQLQAGEGEKVREELDKYIAVDLDSQKVMWLLASAALAMREGRTSEARHALGDFQDRVPFDVYDVMAADAFFDEYRSRPEYLVYFFNGNRGTSAGL